MSIYYEDDWVTLYHGDCLAEHREWLDADVLVTDPPYGIGWQGIANYTPAGGTATSQPPIAGDLSLATRDAALTLWGDGPAIIFGSWRKERPRNVKHRLVWWKRGQAPGPTRSPFVIQDEEIYILGDGWPKSDTPTRSVIPTDEARSIEVSRVGHPTPKPAQLMEVLITKCPPGAIADPFAGSGSTLVAAKALGRKAIGVELEERYCEIAANRLSQDVLDFGSVAS